MSNALNRLQQESFTKIVDNEKITKHLSGMLPKFAGLMALTLAVSAVSFDVHADQKTANKIAGLLAAGATVGYMSGNTEQAKAMTAATVGAYAGGRLVDDKNATAGAVIGAGLAYGYTNNALNQNKMKTQYNNGYGNNNNNYPVYNNGNAPVYNNGNNNSYPVYNNGNNNSYPVYNNGNNNNYPVYNNNNYPQERVSYPQERPHYNQQPKSMILYQVTGQNNGNNNFYVTVDNSMAVKQFNNITYANRDLNEDVRAQREISVSYNNYVNSYNELQRVYQEYERTTMGSNVENEQIRRQMLYSTDPNGAVAVNSNNNRGNQLYQVKQRLEQAATNYGVSKGTFFINVDNAAFEGYDVKGYAQAMNYVKPPEEIRVALNGSNKYPIVKDNRVAFTMR